MLIKISQIQALIDDGFCCEHAYDCDYAQHCWWSCVDNGTFIICDEAEDNPLLVEDGEVGE